MQRTAEVADVSILLVDDHSPNLVALEAVLEPLEQRLVKAASGYEALKLLLQEDFACILLDVQMPGLDGFETARLIKQRERSRHIPILFLTALHREEAHILRGYSQGAVDYVVKPFEPDILRAKVKVFVDLHRRELRVREGEAQSRHRELNQRTALFTDAIPQIAWVARSDGAPDAFNQRWYEYTGEPPGSLGPHAWERVCHPDDLPPADRLWAGALARSEPFEAECRLRRASDQVYRWHLLRTVPVPNAQGQVEKWIGIGTDIHELKLARTVAERERQWLYRLCMEAPAIVAIHRGPEHVFEFSNAVHTRLLGNRELLGKSVRQAQPDLEGQGIFELLDRVYQTGEVFVGKEVPAHVGNPDNPRTGYFNFVYQPMPGLDGRTEGVMVFGFEVTDQVLARQQAEVLAQQLQASEAQLRTMANSIPQLAWIAEPDGSIHWYNQRWFEYTGTTLDEMEAEDGWGWKRVHDPAELPRVMVRFQACVASGEPWEDTFPLRRKDGEFRWHLSRAMPVRDLQGRIVRWFGTNTDVEDQRRQAAALQEAVQARDIFLSVASHELKTPLTPLSLRLAQLKRDAQGTLPDQQPRKRELQQLEIAEAQVRKLAVLVDGLLDVSRITQGRLSLSLQDVDVAEIVRETVKAMEPQAARAGSSIVIEAQGQAVGRFDPVRLEQVVTNLLSNAIKFGAGRPILVSLTAGEQRFHLTVRDEGIGIAAEYLQRIFDRFERAVSDRHYGGMGLGLWVARQLVEAMGGTVQAESLLGQGATFTVDLPR